MCVTLATINVSTDRETVATAFHLHEFVSNDLHLTHNFNIPEDICHLVNALVIEGAHQPPPERPILVGGRLGKRRNPNDIEYAEYRYPAVWTQWVTHKTELARAIKAFRQGTEHLQASCGLSPVESASTKAISTSSITFASFPTKASTPLSAPTPNANMAGGEGNAEDEGPLRRADFQQMMAASVAEAVRQVMTEFRRNGPPDGGDPPAPPDPGSSAAGASGASSKLKADELGYFDPAADGDGDIVNVGKLPSSLFRGGSQKNNPYLFARRCLKVAFQRID